MWGCLKAAPLLSRPPLPRVVTYPGIFKARAEANFFVRPPSTPCLRDLQALHFLGPFCSHVLLCLHIYSDCMSRLISSSHLASHVRRADHSHLRRKQCHGSRPSLLTSLKKKGCSQRPSLHLSLPSPKSVHLRLVVDGHFVSGRPTASFLFS